MTVWQSREALAVRNLDSDVFVGDRNSLARLLDKLEEESILPVQLKTYWLRLGYRHQPPLSDNIPWWDVCIESEPAESGNGLGPDDCDHVVLFRGNSPITPTLPQNLFAGYASLDENYCNVHSAGNQEESRQWLELSTQEAIQAVTDALSSLDDIDRLPVAPPQSILVQCLN